ALAPPAGQVARGRPWSFPSIFPSRARFRTEFVETIPILDGGAAVHRRPLMARTDALVLGAGIVGTSIALHLVKRGLSVGLVDRHAPGRETSYGNAGVIESNTLFPHPFPQGLGALLRVAFKQAPEANYHAAFLPQVAPWLLAYRANSTPERRAEFA